MINKLPKVDDVDVALMNELVAGTSYSHNGKDRIHIDKVSGFNVTKIVQLVEKYFVISFEVAEQGELVNVTIRITGANPDSTLEKLRNLFPVAKK